jgi:hypothetical protein
VLLVWYFSADYPEQETGCMPTKKSTNLQELRRLFRQAKAEGNEELLAELELILTALHKPRQVGIGILANLLNKATSHVTKHYIAGVLGAAKDVRVLKFLIRAATQPENRGYTANYFWACAHYDCTSYLPFFVRFLLECEDPGEAMVACVAVIEAMEGPFIPAVVKRFIAKLLQRKQPLLPSDLQLQSEVFIIQAGYALLDKYFDQVDKEWKKEVNAPKYEQSVD